LDNSNIVASAGIVASKLAGYPSDAAKFLRGDGSWGTLAGELNYVQFTSDVTISATTAATANTIVTGGSISYDGATIALIEVFVPGCSSGDAGSEVVLTLYQDGVGIGLFGAMTIDGNAIADAFYGVRRMTPSSGSHTYSLRGYRVNSNNNSSVQAGVGGAGVPLPGFIRITKV
jgi:hypothetical protein